MTAFDTNIEGLPEQAVWLLMYNGYWNFWNTTVTHPPTDSGAVSRGVSRVADSGKLSCRPLL